MNRSLLPLFALLLSFLLLASTARGKAVEIPLTIDTALLRALMVQQAFTLPGEKADILKQADACQRILLSDLRLSEERGMLRLQTRVELTWGTPVMAACLTPFSWEGYVVLWQQPQVTPRWQLTMTTIDSIVLDANSNRTQVADLLWDLLKTHVHAYLNRIAINLAPPVKDLQTSLLPMFDRAHQQAAQRFFFSMRPGRHMVLAEGLQVTLLAEMDLPPPSPAPDIPPQPSAQEYNRVLELWQIWDDFLVLQLKQFTDAPLTDDDRRILLETMLTMRYEFAGAIARDHISNAFVRDQFMRAWRQLAPLFRRHLHNSPTINPLGYLAFITANDALHVLDTLGPGVGIEISGDGFRRLAALISSEAFERPATAIETDQQLRKVLGLEPLPEPPLPNDQPVEGPNAPEAPIPTSRHAPGQWQRLAASFLPARALAADPPPPSDIKEWTAELTSATELLPKVQRVLQQAAEKQQEKLNGPAATMEWFKRLILAFAWQESCFRQFHVSNNTITYLLSPNRTSVGVMQVNEQIWRGVYNSRHLRWNINYNSQAGSEIMTLYLHQFLLREKAPIDLAAADGQRFLAAWLYSLYNGGPGQTKPFVKRYAADKLQRTDALFLAKFDAVQANNWMDQVECLQ